VASIPLLPCATLQNLRKSANLLYRISIADIIRKTQPKLFIGGNEFKI